MRKIFMAMAFLCAMILTTTASAANWVSFGSDNFGNEYFVDSLSVTLEEKDEETMMFKATFKTAFSDEGRKAFEQETLGEAISICAFAVKGPIKLISQLESTYYALDKSILYQDDTETKWQAIKPNSIIEVMYEAALEHLKQ